MSVDPATEPDLLIADFEALGVHLWAQDGGLRYRAPQGVMTDERRALLRTHKEALLAALSTAAEPETLRPDPDHRHDPFPLTDVQAAYLLGRGSVYEYGGVGCHGYGELVYPTLDTEALET